MSLSAVPTASSQMMAGFSPELLSAVALSALTGASAVSLASHCWVASRVTTQMTHISLELGNYLKML